MPCLNEAETLATCIDKAMKSLKELGIDGEVLIADNGSTDGSQEIARQHGARVVSVEKKGYGAALQGGIAASTARFIIMGDADDSYDFGNLGPFVAELRNGTDLVMGNRFKGGIAPGAMPFLHKYLGNPVLSFIGKLFFKAPCNDFHCGLRGFNREAIMALGLRTYGMEFASEMVVRACMAGLKIVEVPTTLSKDGRSKAPHLNTWRDGWRHLRFLLMYSPRWLFFYPGLALFLTGILVSALLWSGPVAIGNTKFDFNTFAFANLLVILGFQSISFAAIVRKNTTQSGLMPPSAKYAHFLEAMTLERMLLFSLGLFIIGLYLFLYCFFYWMDIGFSNIDTPRIAREISLSIVFFVCSFHLMLTSFLSSITSIPFDQKD
jgi:glycosyltransferase involved in cell wall biosynthesis